MPRNEIALPAAALPGKPTVDTSEARINAIVAEHFDAVWCFLRHMNVPDADDTAQEVMLIAIRKAASIQPGGERGFLLGTAYRVAIEAHRAVARRREVESDALSGLADDGPGLDVLLDEERGRQILREILGELSVEQRAVYVLAEIEEISMIDIAALLHLPPGTVASRLRRAREVFDAHLHRLQIKYRLLPTGSR